MSAPLRVIDSTDSGGTDWRELWQARELLYFLAWRDVKVRYKQTVLGVLWAVLQPLSLMLVFYLFFGRLAGMAQRTGDTPYPLFVLAGLLPWTFFSEAVTTSSNSLVGGAQLITKVYFPRLVIPLSAVGAALVNLGVALVILLVMMAAYGIGLTWHVLLAPFFILGLVVAASGAGSLFAALTVDYRDFRYLVPFMLQVWMFITPVIYPLEIVPERWRLLLYLNPLSGLVEGFRGALLGRPAEWTGIALSAAGALALFAAGASYFQGAERRFADVI